ncbi:DUF2730 family protein [Mameliella sp. AT18]|uniref:DUF2730 family protein n=1 Tax=Mameliella TaxID=1434019 RepID=UPI000840FEED|nr:MULTISPECIES: DUF2730 family protein [Mameliella]MCR9273232.1 DUF2730 domain-containing protein [Paracoccaceae bacterium]MDD9731045.1 DUF2730 family protein [Mameliella sp. AT18]ODM46515.1 hypothetical protein A9320_26185 [Ruegeria sp. PBVC088]OWV58309.1 hypothetical protein CDZ98_14915 [Mameliella alba]
MSYDLIKILLDGAALVISLVAMSVAVMRTRQSALDDRLKTGSGRMDDQDKRISSLEQTVASLPAKEDLHGLELRFGEFGAQLSRIETTVSSRSEETKRLYVAVERIENYLLNIGGRP